MRWIKVAAAVVGVLIVFMVIGAIVHLVMDLVFAALVVGAIAVAIKVATGRKKLPRGRDERQERRVREVETETTVRYRPPMADPPAASRAKVNVDDDLARLKREMGG
jgi:hypothetical protein